MPNNKVLVTTCLLMMLAALAADRSMARWTFPQPKPVALNTFPIVIGPWHGGEDRPMNPEVRKVIKTARSMDRVYTNASTKDALQLLLLTGDDTGDFHNPAVCFPSQGWTLNNRHRFTFNGQSIIAMEAEQEGQRIIVWYWWYRNDPFDQIKLPHLPYVKSIYRMRLRIAGDNAGTSLFVRVIVPETGTSQQTINGFVHDIWPHVERLAATGGAKIVDGQLVERSRTR